MIDHNSYTSPDIVRVNNSRMVWLENVARTEKLKMRIKYWSRNHKGRYYEGRLLSSWTHLITPSRNFVEVRWRSLLLSTSLAKRCTSYNAPPTSRKNVLQTVNHFYISCHGAPFSWLETPSNRMGQDLNWILCSAWKKWIGGTPSEHPPYSPHLAPMRFLGSSNHEKGAPRQEISKLSTVCSTFFREVGGVCQGRYFEKETVTAPPQSSDSE
jgi:hypothetical protein